MAVLALRAAPAAFALIRALNVNGRPLVRIAGLNYIGGMAARRLTLAIAAISALGCSSVLGLDDLEFEPYPDAGTAASGGAMAASSGGTSGFAGVSSGCSSPVRHDPGLFEPIHGASSSSCAEASLFCDPSPLDCSDVTCPGAVGAQFRRIPYQLDSEYSVEERATIDAAAAAWNRASSLVTFVPCPGNHCGRAGEASWHHLRPALLSRVITPTPGEQVSVLDARSPHHIAHELGHVIGLVDVWRRADRDRFVTLSSAYFCGTREQRLEAARCTRLESDDRYRPDVEFGTLGAFDARSKMNVVSSFICDRRGIVPDASSFEPTPGDGSAVSELYRTLGGWRPFAPTLDDREAGPSAHLLKDGVRLQGSVSLSSSLYPELLIWATGSDGRVYVKSKQSSSVGFVGWSAWDDVGAGQFDSDPAAISWMHTEPTHVVVRQAGGDIAWTHSRTGGSGWNEWGSIGAPPGGAGSAPALASRGSNRLDVFVRGKLDDRLYHKTYDGSWGAEWTQLGDMSFKGKPAALGRGDYVDVVVTGRDDAVWRLSSTPNWADHFESLGGRVHPGSSPALANSPSGLVVFVRGAENSRLYANFLQGSWTGWEELGGILAGDPAAISTNGNQLEVVAPIDDNGAVGVWWRLWSSTSPVVE